MSPPRASADFAMARRQGPGPTTRFSVLCAIFGASLVAIAAALVLVAPPSKASPNPSITAELLFRPVLEEGSGVPVPVPTAEPTSDLSMPDLAQAPKVRVAAFHRAETVPVEAQFAYETLDCTDPANLADRTNDPDDYFAACNVDGSSKYLLGPASIVGSDIASASAELPQSGIGNWLINVVLTEAGAATFEAETKRLAGETSPRNQFAIVINGVVRSAPAVVNGPITSGVAQITGDFTQREAEDLAAALAPVEASSTPGSPRPETTDAATASSSNGGTALVAGLSALAFLLLVGAVLAYRRQRTRDAALPPTEVRARNESP